MGLSELLDLYKLLSIWSVHSQQTSFPLILNGDEVFLEWINYRLNIVLNVLCCHCVDHWAFMSLYSLNSQTELSWLNKSSTGPMSKLTKQWVNLLCFVGHMSHAMSWLTLVGGTLLGTLFDSAMSWTTHYAESLTCHYFLQIQPG